MRPYHIAGHQSVFPAVSPTSRKSHMSTTETTCHGSQKMAKQSQIQR